MHRAEARHEEDVRHEIHEQAEVHREGRGAERIPGAADHAGAGAPVPGQPVVSGRAPRSDPCVPGMGVMSAFVRPRGSCSLPFLMRPSSVHLTLILILFSYLMNQS